jgi:hypothetical protein
VRRRRRLPPDLAAAREPFEAALGCVERAKEAIVEAVPRARNPGRPLAEALFEFEEGLREAALVADRWWHPSLDASWRACRDGIADALARSERLRVEAPDLSFEELAFTVQDLIAPLEPFGAALRSFRELRS